jgi:hypothetical protein
MPLRRILSTHQRDTASYSERTICPRFPTLPQQFCVSRKKKPITIMNFQGTVKFDNLSIYLSVYLPTYLYVYLSIYGSLDFVELGRFSVSRSFTQSVGLLGRGISPSQGRYLHTGQHKYRTNAHIHPYLEWNSNPRSQRSNGRRGFMP